MSSATVKLISESFVKPKYEVEESKKPYYLGPMDLAMLSFHYIQKGLLFTKAPPLNDYQNNSSFNFLESLKHSLSLTLIHFYPLAGQLATEVDEDRHEILVFVDCNKGPGVKFIHATLDMNMNDILAPTDVPLVVQSFFDHDRAVNYDGLTRPLLSVQVTELNDTVFIGCSMNHAVVDGTSYWHFWNIWSEIHRGNGNQLPPSRLPVHKRWFPDGFGPKISLPFTDSNEFVDRYESPQLRERIFHFSSDSVAMLKAKANEECETTDISSFQSLSALIWRSIVRANCIPYDQLTDCRLPANNRNRLQPPLPPEYLGVCVTAVRARSRVCELLEHNFGWAALLLKQSVSNHSDNTVRDFFNDWMQFPFIYQLSMSGCNSVLMGSSPRFNVYDGNEFGLGRAITARSGYANKFPGKVTAYPGQKGNGSVDLEICLTPDSMRALESDEEFTAAIS